MMIVKQLLVPSVYWDFKLCRQLNINLNNFNAVNMLNCSIKLLCIDVYDFHLYILLILIEFFRCRHSYLFKL